MQVLDGAGPSDGEAQALPVSTWTQWLVINRDFQKKIFFWGKKTLG